MKSMTTLLLIFLSGVSYACTCVLAGENLIENEIKSRDIIITGTVVEIDTITRPPDEGFAELGLTEIYPIQDIFYTFRVTSIYKGKIRQNTITIESGSVGADDCKYVFRSGLEYIVYANYELDDKLRKVKSRIKTSQCARTSLLSKEQLEKLENKLKKKIPRTG